MKSRACPRSSRLRVLSILSQLPVTIYPRWTSGLCGRRLTPAALLLACPLLWICDVFDRRLAALRYYRTAEATVCESQLRGETPKYWAGPEELLPRYADGILVGQLTEG